MHTPQSEAWTDASANQHAAWSWQSMEFPPSLPYPAYPAYPHSPELQQPFAFQEGEEPDVAVQQRGRRRLPFNPAATFLPFLFFPFFYRYPYYPPYPYPPYYPPYPYPPYPYQRYPSF